MVRRHATLIGGPMDGGQEILEQSTDQLLVEYDFIEALIGSYYFHVFPVTDATHRHFEEQLECQRMDDPHRGWQVLLYREAADGCFHYVRKLNGLDP
jgi:hypothetical protein